MKKRHLYHGSMMLGIVFCAAFLAFPGSIKAAEPILIKFSHVVAADTPKGKGAQRFKELAEKYTNGAVKIEIYPNSTLYKDKEEIEALQLGAVHMLAPSISKFGPLGIREFEVFDLPYIISDYEALKRVTNGVVGQRLFSKLEQRGLKGLAYWNNGFKVFSANTLLKKPEDFRGKKMRIQSSKVLEEQMRELQALPQVMAFSEVYQALQTGVVDGTENTISNYYTQKVHEVQKYITLSDHGYIGYAVITNRRFWDSLPEDVRSQLELAMQETTIFTNAIAQQENKAALEAIRLSGRSEILVLTDAEKAALKKSLLPVHKKMASRIGADLIQDVYKATGIDPAKD